jgi:hypothetical protein
MWLLALLLVCASERAASQNPAGDWQSPQPVGGLNQSYRPLRNWSARQPGVFSGDQPLHAGLTGDGVTAQQPALSADGDADMELLTDLGSGVGREAAAMAADEFGSGEPAQRTSLQVPVPAVQTGDTPTMQTGHASQTDHAPTTQTGHAPTEARAETGAPAEPQCTASEGVLHCWMTGCTAECFSEVAAALLMLFIAGMAANTFGNLLSGFGFPAITIFLFFGIVLGPYGTNVVTVPDSKRLLWCVLSPPLSRAIRACCHTCGFSLPWRGARSITMTC